MTFCSHWLCDCSHLNTGTEIKIETFSDVDTALNKLSAHKTFDTCKVTKRNLPIGTPFKLCNAVDKGQDFRVHCITLLLFLALYFGALVRINLNDAPGHKGMAKNTKTVRKQQNIN